VPLPDGAIARVSSLQLRQRGGIRGLLPENCWRWRD